MNTRTRYVFSACLPLVAAASFMGTAAYITHHQKNTAPLAQEVVIPPVENPPPEPTLKTTTVLEVGTIEIVAPKPKYVKVAKMGPKPTEPSMPEKEWTCGDWEETAYGTHVQRCEWR